MIAYCGNFVFTPTRRSFRLLSGGCVLVDGDGVIQEVLDHLPPDFPGRVVELGPGLALPGFVDCHVHASQYPTMGLGYNLELLPWLEKYTLPQEARLHKEDYALRVYRRFVRELWRNGITRSIVMASNDTGSTYLLFDLLAKSGLGAYVGRVCMDQNTPDRESTAGAIRESRRFLQLAGGKSALVRPIVTPTLSMVCSHELMAALGRQAAEFSAPIQAHLSENREEIRLTLKYFPEAQDFGDTYDQAGCFGQVPTVMAHCIHLTDREKERMAARGILAAHNPHSNWNLLSGAMKLAEYHDLGIRVGLGSDIAGGHTLSMFSTMAAAVQAGACHYVNGVYPRPVTAPEALYTATKGGGSFFGKVGSFEPGYDFDCLAVDDSAAQEFNSYSLEERAERMIYCCDDRNILRRFVKGREVFEPLN